jgi:flavin reductase (DIM6/NTAB) family NADH-FMN oxidoreductase RutF
MSPDLSSLSPVPAEEYVAAVAQHVASVCVITTEHEGERFGLTATAVASVSATPARLLVCVNKSGQSHDKILASRRFCVNVLTEPQDKVAMVFAGMAGAGADRFSVGEWTTLVTGAPALIGAAASFDCRLASISEQSTHSVIFGDVLATRYLSGEDALLYGVRRFRQMRKVFTGLAGDDEYL